jgi:hypothetical protein
MSSISLLLFTSINSPTKKKAIDAFKAIYPDRDINIYEFLSEEEARQLIKNNEPKLSETSQKIWNYIYKNSGKQLTNELILKYDFNNTPKEYYYFNLWNFTGSFINFEDIYSLFFTDDEEEFYTTNIEHNVKVLKVDTMEEMKFSYSLDLKMNDVVIKQFFGQSK